MCKIEEKGKKNALTKKKKKKAGSGLKKEMANISSGEFHKEYSVKTTP